MWRESCRVSWSCQWMLVGHFSKTIENFLNLSQHKHMICKLTLVNTVKCNHFRKKRLTKQIYCLGIWATDGISRALKVECVPALITITCRDGNMLEILAVIKQSL